MLRMNLLVLINKYISLSLSVVLSKEVGKQSSELRMTFTCNNTLNEGWCETLHHIRIHSKKGGVRPWCGTLVRDFTSHKNTLNEEWCETLV